MHEQLAHFGDELFVSFSVAIQFSSVTAEDMWDNPVTYHPRKEGSAVSGN